jgi:hypothetical protein
VGIFETGSLKLFTHWLPTAILLISASWVSRTIGVSHQHLAQDFLILLKVEISKECLYGIHLLILIRTKNEKL